MKFENIRTEKFIFVFVIGLVAFLILLPLLFLIYGSLTTRSYGELVSHLTFKNYIKAYSSARYFNALLNTLIISTFTTLTAAILGISIAWIVTRTNTPLKRFIEIMIIVPFFLSPFMGAVAWSILLAPKVGILSMFFEKIPFIGAPNIFSIYGIVWVMGLYYTPYIFLFASSALKSMDPSLEEAAIISGMSPIVGTTLRITLPIISPAIISGMLLTFVASAGQFGVPAILGTPFNYYVLTTRIFDLTQIYPSRFNLAAAISVALLFISMIGVYLQNRVLRAKSFVTISARGFRPKLIDLKWKRYLTLSYCMGFILFAVGLPVCILAYVSFVKLFTGDYSFSLITLENYEYILFKFPLTLRAIRNSLFLGFSGATIGVMLALVISWIIQRSTIRGRKTLEYIATLPIAIPSVVIGIALLWTWIYIPLPIYGTIWILLIGYITGFIPYAIRSTSSAIVQIDRSLEEAATMIGAKWLRLIKEVTFPLVKPGILAGWILLFVIFIRELAISMFLYSPNNEVLSVLIFNLWYEGNYPVLCAISMLQIVLIGSLLFIVTKLFKIEIFKTI